MKVYGGHVLGEIFTPEKYAKTHPEYYSLIDAWDQTTAEGRGFGCRSFSGGKDILDLYTPELLKNCRSDLEEAERLADTELIRKRVAFYGKGLRYTELTVLATRASIKLEKLGSGPGSRGKAEQKSEQASREDAGKLARDALRAWQARDAFVEELKNDYVLAYFWVRYNNRNRGFNQTRYLRELLKTLDSQ